MGAWNYEPMENDEALEWLANEVEVPLLTTIERTLQTFLRQTEKDEVKTIEAEAAVALLVDLTGDHAKMKYTRINSAYLAKERGLWALGTRTITKIMEDKDWLSGWNQPEQKLQVLRDLLSDLQHIEEKTKG